MKSYPGIKKVKPLDNYKLLLTFSNGELPIFNAKPFLNKGIFRELQDFSLFKKVSVRFDTIEWKNGADFDPESLYDLSEKFNYRTASAKERLNIAAEPSPTYKKG